MLGERSVFVSHMTSGASLVVCAQRINAVRRLLDVVGPADPCEAQRPIVGGNWRAEFGIDEFSNAIHGRFYCYSLVLLITCFRVKYQPPANN